ncbi:MAG: FHA domain-containing protein [Cyanobacteria bacterium]|nr:FHA domain-containing protein [Cyanobacteriota bacterium]
MQFASLELRDNPRRRVNLDPAKGLTIGRAPDNGLCLPEAAGLSRQHAQVRRSRTGNQWLVCDLGSANGTWLEGVRVRQCRPLGDGDEIRLGSSGPVLVFRCGAAQAAGPDPLSIDVGDQRLSAAAIRSVRVESRALYPHIFSWWLLLCLGGLLLLPLPLLFWPLELLALAGWMLLGARKEHLLEVVTNDGLAHRHRFRNRLTALAHRNGIRRAIGQSQGP